ncbi:hypothetical protein D3C81_2060040 [compost metagenome]
MFVFHTVFQQVGNFRAVELVIEGQDLLQLSFGFNSRFGENHQGAIAGNTPGVCRFLRSAGHLVEYIVNRCFIVGFRFLL